MKTIEYWRWRYRNVETGRICRTMFGCSADEAAQLYPGAEPIEGTMVLREVDDRPNERAVPLARSPKEGPRL
jgi:hypothetical protein